MFNYIFEEHDNLLKIMKFSLNTYCKRVQSIRTGLNTIFFKAIFHAARRLWLIGIVCVLIGAKSTSGTFVSAASHRNPKSRKSSRNRNRNRLHFWAQTNLYFVCKRIVLNCQIWAVKIVQFQSSFSYKILKRKSRFINATYHSFLLIFSVVAFEVRTF